MILVHQVHAIKIFEHKQTHTHTQKKKTKIHHENNPVGRITFCDNFYSQNSSVQPDKIFKYFPHTNRHTEKEIHFG